MTEQFLYTSFLVFVRVAGFIYASPIIGGSYIPKKIKSYLCLLVTIFLVSYMEPVVAEIPSSVSFGFYVLANMCVGLFFGLMLNVTFSFLSLGGHIIAMGTGLGFAMMSDPVNGTQTTSLSLFYKIVGSLLFVGAGGLLSLFWILQTTFTLISLTPTFEMVITVEYVLMFFTYMLESALLLSVPVIFAVFLVNLCFGVISKASPGLNIFAVGFPAGILVGFIFIYLTIDAMPLLIIRYIDQLSVFMAAL